jgi:hypothetical protein
MRRFLMVALAALSLGGTIALAMAPSDANAFRPLPSINRSSP